MCPSYLATRDEKDSTRGRARVLQEMANGALVPAAGGRRRCTTRSTCACPARPVLADCPAGVDMAPYKSEVPTRPTAGGCDRARTTRSAGCPAGPGWRRRAPAGQRGCCGSGRWPAPLRGRGRDRPAPAMPPFAPIPFRRSGRSARRHGRVRPAADAGGAVGRLLHRRASPRGGRGRGHGAASAGYRAWSSRTAGVLRADLDQHRPAGRGAPPPAGAAGRPGPVRRAGIPIVGLEPSCTAVLRVATWPTCSPATPGPPRSPRRPARSPSCSPRRRWPGPRGPADLAGTEVIAQPHCHHHSVMGFGADRALLSAAGRHGHHARRLLRPGGQLRHGERPLRGLGGGRGARRCCPRCGAPPRARSSWPTGSPAAPRPTSSPASAAPTWPRSSLPAPRRDASLWPPGRWNGPLVTSMRLAPRAGPRGDALARGAFTLQTTLSWVGLPGSQPGGEGAVDDDAEAASRTDRGRRPQRPLPGPGPPQGRPHLRGVRARRRPQPQAGLLPAHERRRRRGPAPLPAWRPLRALRRDVAADPRPPGVDRARRPAERAQLATAPRPAQRGPPAAHRRPPPHAPPDPAGPPRRFVPAGPGRRLPTRSSPAGSA